MTDEEYEEAGHYFDLMESHSSPCLKNWAEKQDEVYKKREKELKELIDKKNNFPPYLKLKWPYADSASILKPLYREVIA